MANDKKITFKASIEVWSESLASYEMVGSLVRADKPQLFFVPYKYAEPSTINRAFPITKPTSAIGINSLKELSDVLPIKGSKMDAKLKSLLAGFGAKDQVKKLEALLTLGPVERYGVRVTNTLNEPQSIRAINTSRRLLAESVIDKDRAQKLSDISQPLADMLKFMKSGEDCKLMAGNNDYIKQIAKSQGGANLVIPIEIDTPQGIKEKLLKVDLSVNNLEELSLEVVANKVIQKAGFSAPNSELQTIVNSAGGSAKVMIMDNFALMEDWPVEKRRISFSSLLGKDDDEIHNMTYDEMAKGLAILENNLPPEYRDNERLNYNKKQIFNWAMVNSVTNNTDNHGRNLEVMLGENGEATVSPFFDIKFTHEPDYMSTCLDGDPPIHSINVMMDAEIEHLWNQLEIEGSPDEALRSRDKLVHAMADIPKICNELGVRNEEKKIIQQAVGVQSKSLSKLLQLSEKLYQESSSTVTAEKDNSYEPSM